MTPNRTLRIEDDIWEPAKEKAERMGTNVSAVVREKLVEWLHEDDED